MRNVSSQIAILAVILFTLSCATTRVDQRKLRWPLPPNDPKIEFVRFWNGAADFKTSGGWKELLLGKEGGNSNNLNLFKPYGIATDSRGRTYVCDTILARVFVFDTVEDEMRFLGLGGPGGLAKPIGITITSDDNIWVADAGRQIVVRFDPDGNPVGFLGDPTELVNPTSVAVDEANGKVYIADSKGHKINVYDMNSYALITTIGERGGAEGQFNYPTNIAVDKAGYLYIVDSMNFRIQVFASDGFFDGAYGIAGTGPGTLARPRGIAVDPQGNIFIADAIHNSVQLFNADFELLMWLGGYQGIGPGEFIQPSGLWVSKDGSLYVADSLNHRVQVFKLLYLNGANSPSKVGKDPQNSSTNGKSTSKDARLGN